MDIDPLKLGDTPEDYIENEDGSVDIPELEAIVPEDSEFMSNLALEISDKELAKLGSELVELVEKDKKSREKRDQQYEEGLRRTGLGDDAPGGAQFAGASKVVHPVLAEACVDFSARAIKELFPSAGPAKAWVIGENTPQKLEKAERKTRFMNWQMTTEIEEYRSELEQLLTQLPLGGSQYQKFWRDESLGRTRVEFVPIDQVFLPFSATSFYNSPRVTHRQLISRQELDDRIASGLYRDIFVSNINGLPEQSLSTEANDKIEGKEEDGYNEDGLRAILEIQVYKSLGEDDDISPYLITVDEDTEQVYSIYRNWEESDSRRRKLDWMVEWKFIPWRGAYAIGLPHLIGGLAAALTGSLRALLDSAHINNAATMLKLKSGRVVGQNTEVSVTQVCDIEGPAGIDDIRKLAMPMPFNPPSPVLAGLMETLYGLAKGVVATADEKIGQVGDRTPVGTTMALIEQGSHTYSAIHARLHESQKKAMQILHRMNRIYMDEESVIEDLGELTVSRDDFIGSIDVIPVSDPTIFSEAQRFAQSQAVLQMSQQDAQNPNIPWNQLNVRRRILKQMRIENIDDLLPKPKEEVTSDVLTEDTVLLQGHPIKAAPEQDHTTHIKGHMMFLTSPLTLQNPLIPPQALGALIQHIGEHMQMLQTKMVHQYAQENGGGDKAIMDAYEVVLPQLTQELAPVMQAIGQAQAELQKRQPPPPMPPEIQASIQIAQMDTQRKAQNDQAMIQLKQQDQQAQQQKDMAAFQMKQGEQQAQMQLQQIAEQFNQQMAQQRLAQEAQAEQFNQYMEQQRLSQESQIEQLKQQIEMSNNEADNHQKQMTELLKNRDDNQTKIMIEEMKSQLSAMQDNMPPASQQPDLNPQLQQMQQYLDQIGKQQTNDALTSVMEGLQATIQTLNKPKMIIRDAQGKAQGLV